MTQMRKLVFAVTLFAFFALTGCSLNQMVRMADENQLTVEPSPLELHGDSVKFTMSVNLPEKMLKKGKEYIVKPFYVYNGQEIELENIVLRAEEFEGQEQPRVSRTLSFAYEPEMRRGELMVQGVARNPNNDRTRETERMKIAEGVVTTAEMVQENYFSAYADHGYNPNEELEPTVIGFFFQQGSSYLRPSEIRSERGQYLQNFIAEKNVTRSVTITGTHSPEGSERVNANLSQDRASRIEDFYRRNMRRYDYQNMADEINFILKPVVLDWEPFRAALQEYDGISDSQKQEMLNIINGAGSFEEQEERLRRVDGYRQVFKDIYPLLRTAKAEVLTVIEKKSQAEIATLARQIADGTVSADTLSHEELLYAGTLTPSLDEKEQIYQAAIRQQDTPEAHINLGAVYLERAANASAEAQQNQYVEQAVNQFELANRQEETAEAYNNLAVAHFMQGNTERAYESIQQAENLQPTEETGRGIRGVKGALEIRQGNYEQAISTLSNAEETAENLYNLGLAYLLNKDYNNAITHLEEATQKDSQMAKAYYAAAIANARLGREDEAYNQLQQAVQNDQDLRRNALEDLEFSQFQENERFRNTLR
jgi:tetratricopeptide (TPR) repeat protein